MTQPWPVSPPLRTRNWPAIAIAVLAAAIAVVALVLELTRSGAGSRPTYTAAQRAEAKANLCDQSKFVIQAVQAEMQTPDNAALARIAEVNGAGILQIASANPALDVKYRDAAESLASAFRNETALAARGSDDPSFQAAVKDTNAKGSVVQGLCGD